MTRETGAKKEMMIPIPAGAITLKGHKMPSSFFMEITKAVKLFGEKIALQAVRTPIGGYTINYRSSMVGIDSQFYDNIISHKSIFNNAVVLLNLERLDPIVITADHTNKTYKFAGEIDLIVRLMGSLEETIMKAESDSGKAPTATSS